jgi:hypothetical protein
VGKSSTLLKRAISDSTARAGEGIPYGRTIDALVAYLQKRGVEFLMQGDIGIGIKVVRIIEDEECEEEDKKAKRKNSKAGGELAPNATDK